MWVARAFFDLIPTRGGAVFGFAREPDSAADDASFSRIFRGYAKTDNFLLSGLSF